LVFCQFYAIIIKKRGEMYRRWIFLMVLMTLGVGLLASAVWAIDEVPQGVEEKTPDLIIFYTGNVSGHIEPCG